MKKKKQSANDRFWAFQKELSEKYGYEIGMTPKTLLSEAEFEKLYDLKEERRKEIDKAEKRAKRAFFNFS